MFKLISYSQGSASAKALANALDIKRIKHVGPPIKITKSVINWGSTSFPDRVLIPIGVKVFNYPDSIQRASNKLHAFLRLKGSVPMPAFSESREEAKKWLPDGIVCRTVLNGHSGKGIVLAMKEEEIVNAPLYTKYIKKDQEYRLHVFKDKVFFIQRKARKYDVPDEEVNWQIRNHANGFIYANKEVDVPDIYKEHAIKAVNILGLDFGAVDIISDKDNNPFILEINTAPGLTGTTLEKYVEIFSNL